MAVDITGINDLSKVENAAITYRDALIKKYGTTSYVDSTVLSAMKGSNSIAAYKVYDEAVKTKIEVITSTLNRLITSLEDVQTNYTKMDTSESLNTAAAKLKS